QGLPARPVTDLLATTYPGSDNQSLRISISYRREQAPLCHFDRNFIMLGLVTKRPGHATTARIHLADVIISWKRQRTVAWPCTDQRLLVAVTMQQNLPMVIGKFKIEFALIRQMGDKLLKT